MAPDPRGVDYDPPINTKTYRGLDRPAAIQPSTSRKVMKIPSIIKAMLLTTLMLYSMVSTLLWILILKEHSLSDIFRAIAQQVL